MGFWYRRLSEIHDHLTAIELKPGFMFWGERILLINPQHGIFISGWDATALKARFAFGVPDHETLEPPEKALERRNALRAVKQRLHQASFPEAVISAYNGRCALSRLPEPLLLDST